jgi:cbb3-type cytochrome oxidase maturation protein
MSLLSVWALYIVLGVTLFSALFLWAVRERQFTDQDRARYMPLRKPEPDADDTTKKVR